MTRTEGAVIDPQGGMLPPWLKFPDMPFGSIGWRMGDGEAYLEAFFNGYQHLTGKQQAALRSRYVAPEPWRMFYFARGPLTMTDASEADAAKRHAMAGIYGALTGDALGVPFEFKAPECIPPAREIEMAMPSDFEKTYSAIPYGTWSDDGAQLLCLLEALQAMDWHWALARADLPAALGRLLLRWLKDGHQQSGGVVFDCGGQTAKSLELIEAGLDPLKAGGTERQSNGNGSLMRTLPVACGVLLRNSALDEAVNIAHLQSRITHAHPLAQVCCSLYSLTAVYVFKERQREFATECLLMAADILSQIYAAHQEKANLDALREIMEFPKTHFLRGSGYVVDALWTAVDSVARTESYVDAVRRAISHGNDTDTSACLAGGLAGLRYGFGDNSDPGHKGIPAEWIAALRMTPDSSALLGEVFGQHPGMRPDHQ